MKDARSKECFDCSGRNNQKGLSRSGTYKTWSSMKQRCYSPKMEAFKFYGERGITVCERWLNSFENFLTDMGERPEKKTLDRIDNSKGYFKENCRWATINEQARNTTTNHFIEVGGQRMTIIEWSEKTGLTKDTIAKRIKYGFNPEECVSTERFFKKRYLEAFGKKQRICDWEKETGISSSAIICRLKRNWQKEIALTKPVRAIKQPTRTRNHTHLSIKNSESF